MKYEDLIKTIGADERFCIVHQRYDEAFFGDYQIDLLFCNSIRIELFNDRGDVEVNLLYPRFLKTERIPIRFALDYLKAHGIYTESMIFDTTEDQDILLHNVNALQIILKYGLLGKIARQWGAYQRRMRH